MINRIKQLVILLTQFPNFLENEIDLLLQNKIDEISSIYSIYLALKVHTK
jgi:hypothetical protein